MEISHQMKVGFDARGAIWYRGTGIGTYTYQLVENLKKIDEHKVCQFFWPGDENKYSLRNAKIDIYHVPQNGHGLPKKKSCLQVATVHDLIPYIYPEDASPNYLRTVLNEMPRIMEQSDLIITVSEHSKRDIQRYFNLPNNKVVVTYEAPESVYRPIEEGAAKDFVKGKYNIHSPYILYIGGFSTRKNVKTLINAFHEIRTDIPKDYKLVLVGKKVKDAKMLEIMINDLGLKNNSIFTGFLPVVELPYLYNASDLFVYPSLYEGFGLPPLEAMACGTPVIASNTSSMPEVTGDAAILINPKDTHGLAEAMVKVLNSSDLRDKMSKDGLLQANKFTWEKCARETLGAYNKLYNQRKK